MPLLFAACAGVEPGMRAEQRLAAGDLRGALADAWDATPQVRAQIAATVMRASNPTLTLARVPLEELARVAGTSTVRQIDPGWVVIRARADAASSDLAAELELALLSDGRPVHTVPPEPKALAYLTGERYPSDIKHWTLATGDFPWPLHVLTGGILTVLTLHEKVTWSPPPDERVRAAVPRALRLLAALRELSSGARLLVLPRPARDDVPLELRVVVTVRAGGGFPVSLAVVVPVPPGGALHDRLARAATALPLAALPGAAPVLGTQRVIEQPCDDPLWVRIPSSRCAPIAPARWPTDDITPFGIEPPPRPERLGTPLTSLAARPRPADPRDGAADSAYAPDVPVQLLDRSLPVPDDVEGGVLSCNSDALSVPDDADHVYALVTIAGRTFRLNGARFELPLLSLSAKARLLVTLYDMDYLSGDDWLAAITLARQGDSMSGTWGSTKPRARGFASMKCRIFGREAVEAAFVRAWPRAVDALDRVEEMPAVVDLAERDFGRRNTELARARARVEAVVGLVGWDDPRVRALLDRWDSLDARFFRAVRVAVERLAADATGAVVLRPADEPGVEVIDAATSCGPGTATAIRRSPRVNEKKFDPAWLEAACLIHLTVENRGNRVAYTTAIAGELDLLLDDGRVLPTSALAHAEIPAGQRASLAVFPSGQPPAPSSRARPWRLVRRGFRRDAILPVLKPAD